jgi:hypothetical protein
MRGTGARLTGVIIAVLILLLIIVTAYSVLEIGGLQSKVNSLQGQNSFQQSELQNLQSAISNLESQVSALSGHGTPVGSFDISYACISLTAGCGGLMYYIVIEDKGNTSVPKGYGIFVSFKDSTKSTFFGFNTTLPRDITPSQGATIEGTSWPAGAGAESKLAQGDQVGVAVDIKGVTASTGTHVLSCNQYPTTTTFLNDTRTQTQILTTQTCV